MKVHGLGMTYVKSTRFLSRVSFRIDHDGVAGDRRFILLDEHDRPVAPQHHGLFIPLEFNFDEAEQTLCLNHPDGRRICEPVDLSPDRIEADFLGLRTIALRPVIGPWDALLTEFSGRPTRLYACERTGAGVDILPLTLVTTGALRDLERQLGTKIEPQRFRANIIIENDLDRAEEDNWDGESLRIGDALLRVRSSVPRCIVTQFNPADGKDDRHVVRALGKYRPSVALPNNLAPSYRSPGFCSYAEVIAPGAIAVGDSVELVGNHG